MKEMESSRSEAARSWRLSSHGKNFRYLKGLIKLHREITSGLYFKVKDMVQQEKKSAGKH